MWGVRAESKYKTIKDVIDDAKSRPNTISLNGGGHGTDDHIAILSMEAATGTKFVVPHFRSTAEGMTQVLGGHIDILAANVSEAAENVRTGKIRGLGVMGPTRSKYMPNVPTFREQGFDQVWAISRGVAGPANLPKDVEAMLIANLEKTITSPGHREKAEKLSLDPLVVKGAEYRKYLKEKEQETKKLMKW
jgi:tripartite-type tricarboxylate transporter receptor subunit TctC